MYSQPGSHNQPAEVFRKDLISAMKLPDSAHLDDDEYFLMADTWKPEWEKGVQVPVNPDRVPCANVEEVRPKTPGVYKIPRKLVKLPPKSNDDDDDKDMKGFWQSLEAVCKYDLDETDRVWLELANSEREESGYPPIDEYTMERIIEECETQCHSNIEHAIQTEEGLGIEYDEDVICDVCRAPDCEEGNEMVFCDKCDVCVHQACYGIINVPEGTWMCRTCALGIQPACLLCGKKGGVMKSTRSGTKWSHVSCALWVPEVSIGCVDRMEPVTKISQIPPSRWALVCNLCRVRTGACIQCSVKTCKTAYHVTCGFENSLEMKTFLDEDSEVRFKSFCLKHCSKKPDVDSPRKQGMAKKEKTQEEKANDRVIRIQRIMEEFYDYAKSDSVASALGMTDDIDTIDLLVQYWKLKRRASFNKPLISFRKEDETPSENEEYNLTARLKMFVHLRQDLERVRNLCYMVQKREKLSKQYLKLKHQIFKKQCEVFSGDTSDLTKEELNLFVNADALSSKERVNERLDKLVKCQNEVSDGDDDTSDVNSPKTCHKLLENNDADSCSRQDADRSVGHLDADVSDLDSEEERNCSVEKFGHDPDLEWTKQEIDRSPNSNQKNRIKRYKRSANGQFLKHSSKKVERAEQKSDVSDDAKRKSPVCKNGLDALREIDSLKNGNVCKERKLSGSLKEMKIEKENDESLSETELLRRTKHIDISQSEQLYDNSDSNLSSDLRTLSLGRRNLNNQKSRTKKWIEDLSDDSLSNEDTSANKTNHLNHVRESDDSISEIDEKPKRTSHRSRELSGNHKIMKNKTFSKDNQSDDSSAEKCKRLPRKQMQSKNSTVERNDNSLKKKESISKTIESKCTKTNNKMQVRTKAMKKIFPAKMKNLVNKLKETGSKRNNVIKSKVTQVNSQDNVEDHKHFDEEVDSDEVVNRSTRNVRKCNRSITNSHSKEEPKVMSNDNADAKTVRESEKSIARPRCLRKSRRPKVNLSLKEESSTPTSDKPLDAEIKSDRESDESVTKYAQDNEKPELSSKEFSTLTTDNKDTDAETKSDSDELINGTKRLRRKCLKENLPIKEELSTSDMHISEAEVKSDRESDDYASRSTSNARKCIHVTRELSIKKEKETGMLNNKDVNADVKSDRDSEESITRSARFPRRCVQTKIDSFPKDLTNNTDTEIRSDKESDTKTTSGIRATRNLRKEGIKSDVIDTNVNMIDKTSAEAQLKLKHCNTNDSNSITVQTNHVGKVDTLVQTTQKAMPMKPKRRTMSVKSNLQESESNTQSLRRSKRTVVGAKNDLEPSVELTKLPNEVHGKTLILDELPVPVTNLHSAESLHEFSNSIQLSNSASDTTINELSCAASPHKNVHLELDDESSSGESHFGIRKTITDFLAHDDSSSGESNAKTSFGSRTIKRLTRSVRNAVTKQLPPKEQRSSTESEDDTKVVEKKVITPPPLIRSESIQNEIVKDVHKLPSPAIQEPVGPLEKVENVTIALPSPKDESVTGVVTRSKEESPEPQLNMTVVSPPANEENTSSSDSDDDNNGSSGDSDTGSQSSSSGSSSSSRNSNSTRNRHSSSSSSDSDSFHTCGSGSEKQVNSEKEEPEKQLAERKVLRRSTRVQTQQQIQLQQQQQIQEQQKQIPVQHKPIQQKQKQQKREIMNLTNSISTNASDDPYHEDHIDAELNESSSPIIDKTIRKRIPEGMKRKEPQNFNPNAFAKKPRKNGNLLNNKKIDSYFKPISQTVENEKSEGIPKLIIRIPECIPKSPTKLKIRVPPSPYNSYSSPRSEDHFQKKRIKINHVNNAELDNHQVKGLNVAAIVRSPETRGARRRIDLKLNSKSLDDREFQNVDNEISICRSSREPSPRSESPQRTERLILRRTTGGNYQISQGSQR